MPRSRDRPITRSRDCSVALFACDFCFETARSISQHACTAAIVHARSLAIVHACTTVIVHARTRAVVHACTTATVHASTCRYCGHSTCISKMNSYYDVQMCVFPNHTFWRMFFCLITSVARSLDLSFTRPLGSSVCMYVAIVLACAMAIVHACTVVIVHARTEPSYMHVLRPQYIVHACVVVIVHTSPKRTRTMVFKCLFSANTDFGECFSG